MRRCHVFLHPVRGGPPVAVDGGVLPAFPAQRHMASDSPCLRRGEIRFVAVAGVRKHLRRQPGQRPQTTAQNLPRVADGTRRPTGAAGSSPLQAPGTQHPPPRCGQSNATKTPPSHWHIPGSSPSSQAHRVTSADRLPHTAHETLASPAHQQCRSRDTRDALREAIPQGPAEAQASGSANTGGTSSPSKSSRVLNEMEPRTNDKEQTGSLNHMPQNFLRRRLLERLLEDFDQRQRELGLEI